jgi:hypothetical protein
MTTRKQKPHKPVKKAAAKKTAAKKNARLRKWAATELRAGALPQAALLGPMNADNQPDPFLGHARAVVIVCHCVPTSPSNLPRTLAQLGVNGIDFQKCVFTGVDLAGYSIALDDIPNAQTNTLLDVVAVIQNAPRKV